MNEQFFIDLIFPGRRDFSTLQIQENSAAHHQAWLFPALLELDAVSNPLITIAIVSILPVLAEAHLIWKY